MCTDANSMHNSMNESCRIKSVHHIHRIPGFRIHRARHVHPTHGQVWHSWALPVRLLAIDMGVCPWCTHRVLSLAPPWQGAWCRPPMGGSAL